MMRPASRPIWLLCWLVALLGICGPLLLPTRTLGFRDAGHYYPPYFRTVQDAWRAGLPLWNPHEERGRPLLADPTAAALYPAQLLLALPLPFEFTWKLFLVSHLLIAATGVYGLGRRWRLDAEAATLASVTYAWSGLVVFQLHNPPYLIGAAWLPWSLWGVERTIVDRPGLASLLSLAVPTSLMIVGGDVQTAYLVFVAGLLAVGCARSAGISGISVRSAANTKDLREDEWLARPEMAPRCAAGGQAGGVALRRVLRLAAAGGLVVSLTAVQLLPTWAWARHSQRALSPAPLGSVVQPAAAPAASVPMNRHSWNEAARYDYSIGPWLWLELIFPNFYGRVAPQSTRWIQVLPAEGRAWSPSLYMGFFTIVLALVGVWRGAERWQVRWLRWLIGLGLIGSLGRFGFGWLVGELASVTGWALPEWSDGAGGLYWLLSMVAPGFRLFRYPAKLWIWAALAGSLLAGFGLQRWLARMATGRMVPATQRAVPAGIPPLPAWIVWARRCVVALAIAVVLAGLRGPCEALAARVPPDSLFGPLQVTLMRQTLVASGLHTLVLCALWMLLERWRSDFHRHLGWAVVVVTLADLIVAHHQLLPYVSTVATQAASPPTGSRLVREHLAAPWRPQYYRTKLVSWYPSAWIKESSPDRLDECLRWDRQTLRAKHHLDEGWHAVWSSTSFSSCAHLGLLQLLDDLAAARDPRWSEVLRGIGCDYVVAPAGTSFAQPSHLRAVEANVVGALQQVRFWQVTETAPRFWVVHQSVWDRDRAPADRRSVAEWADRLRTVWLHGDRRWPLRQRVTLHADGRAVPEPQPLAEARTDLGMEPAACQLIRSGSASRTFQIDSPAAGWLVLNESFLPGWNATIHDERGARRVPVWRANEIMCAVPVQAGRQRLELVYWPREVTWGLIWTGGTMAALLGAGGRYWIQRARAKEGNG
jgi:hypothetical protein